MFVTRGVPLAGHVLIGAVVRTLPAVLGYGAGLAVLLGAFDYTGGVLTGYDKDPSVDEYERKEYLRKNRRRPIQETIEELGEGRGMLRELQPWKQSLGLTFYFLGIYGPGYEERRRERIRQKYGIDVAAARES